MRASIISKDILKILRFKGIVKNIKRKMCGWYGESRVEEGFKVVKGESLCTVIGK